MLSEHLCVAAAERMQELRRSLDVREQQGDRAARQVAHADMMTSLAAGSLVVTELVFDCASGAFRSVRDRGGTRRVSSKSKRQQTAAKRNREQALRERRELKQQKKQAAAAERRMRAAGIPVAREGLSEQEEDDRVEDGAGD